MRKDRMQALRDRSSIDQLRQMKQETLTTLDSYIFERERCESINYQYKNQGLNTKINMNLKKIASLDFLIDEKLGRPKPVLKEIIRGTKKPILDLSIPDGWHKLKTINKGNL